MKAKRIDYMEEQRNEKELLLEAIDNYTFFTIAQRTLLKTLVQINVDNVITANVEELSKLSGTTKTTVYKSLEVLLSHGIIEQIKGPNKGIGILKLKPTPLEEILRIYNKKYNLIKK